MRASLWVGNPAAQRHNESEGRLLRRESPSQVTLWRDLSESVPVAMVN